MSEDRERFKRWFQDYISTTKNWNTTVGTGSLSEDVWHGACEYKNQQLSKLRAQLDEANEVILVLSKQFERMHEIACEGYVYYDDQTENAQAMLARYQAKYSQKREGDV